MPRQVVNSARYHVPVRGFTQAVTAPSSGTLVFVSGLTARNADGTIVAEGDTRGQTRQIFENLKVILKEVGGTLDDVVRTVQYLKDMRDHPQMQEVKREYFGDRPPASTSVEVSRLFDERQLIEIEATAVIQAASAPTPPARVEP
jgi:enamine deaminase RidA (YjgF/YER057c/UK114 family)